MKGYRLVGLTGQTGAGKGQVRKTFESRGYATIDADILAREIMNDSVVLENIKLAFGNDVVNDGVLHRKLLAQRAFKDKESTELLNKVTHPFISAVFIKRLKEYARNGCNKIIFDAPQLFESGLDVLCDMVISVVADKSLRLERIIARDGISTEEAERRMNIQLSEKFFRENSDCIVENNRDLGALEAEVNLLIDRIESIY